MKKLWLTLLLVSLFIQFGCEDPQQQAEAVAEVKSLEYDSSNSSDKAVCKSSES